MKLASARVMFRAEGVEVEELALTEADTGILCRYRVLKGGEFIGITEQRRHAHGLMWWQKPRGAPWFYPSPYGGIGAIDQCVRCWDRPSGYRGAAMMSSYTPRDAAATEGN